MSENKIKVEIANIFGHQELLLNEKETMELIDSNPDHWVFVDNLMVAREHVRAIEFDNVIHVRLMPALVGGGPRKVKNKESPLGKFEYFRHDGLPGHNQSLKWLNEICKSINADVEYYHSRYAHTKAFGCGPSAQPENEIQITFEGKSGSIYCVLVKFNLHAANALANKVRNEPCFGDWFKEAAMDDIYSSWGKANNHPHHPKKSTPSPLKGDYHHRGKAMFKAVKLFDFEVRLYAFSKSDWEGICIGPRNRVEHDADSVAALLCALENDIESAKIAEMNTLRDALKENLVVNWVFNVNPTLTWDETMQLNHSLYDAGDGREIEHGVDEVGGFLQIEFDEDSILNSVMPPPSNEEGLGDLFE